MIDTIGIRLQRNEINQPQYQQLLSKLMLDKTHTNANGKIKHYYKFKNFVITIDDDFLHLNGSLPKYYQGNNVLTLTPDQIKDALQTLNKELGIPILKGALTRLDIADCIVLEHKFLHYINTLTDTPKFFCSKDIYGARYTRQKRQLSFYNKTDEAMLVPEVRKTLLANGRAKDLLRCELRYKSEVRRQLAPHYSKLMAVSLLSATFQQLMATVWYKHYHLIVKRRLMLPIPYCKSWKLMRNYMLQGYLNDLGLAATVALIDNIALSNNWSARTKCDVKKECKRLFYSKDFSSNNQYAEEMNNKIAHSAILLHWPNVRN